MQFRIDLWLIHVLQLKKIVVMILVSLVRKEKIINQIFLLSDISVLQSKKVMTLRLGPCFKDHVFKIQGNDYMSTGGKGFLMNFLDNIPDLVIFLMIVQTPF